MAATIEERIKELEEKLSKTPSNKATQVARGVLKAQIAKLKETGETRKRASGGAGYGYGIQKMGDATVVLVGFPSVGKSTLLNNLTNAESEVGAYEFTTLNVIPGVLEHMGAKIQVLDVPGLIKGASIGKGRGKEVLSVVRIADLIIILLDPFREDQLAHVKHELHEFGMRLNQKKPRLILKKKDRGGIQVNSTVKLTKLNKETMNAILSEYKIHNAEITFYDDMDQDQFIDAILDNRIYVPMLAVLNKVDLVEKSELKATLDRIGAKNCMAISATKEDQLDGLRDKIFEMLEFIRIYTKPPGKEADMNDPLILRKGSTVEVACNKLHRDIKKRFKYGRIWGKSVKFKGQRVGLGHPLEDGDILEIH